MRQANHLVIFDCDGTLVDSQHAIVAAMSGAFKGVGRAPPDRTTTLGIVGLSLNEAMRALVPDASDAEAAALVAGYRDSAGKLRDRGVEDTLYDGILETIADLAAIDHITLGIATGKGRGGVLRMFDRHGWHDHFATIQTADNNPSKPHPQMVLSAMAETGNAPETTLMIGDTTFDMTMARAAGVRAIGVTWGYHHTDMLARSGAHAIVADTVALRREIANLTA